jgi:hypothetical protein
MDRLLLELLDPGSLDKSRSKEKLLMTARLTRPLTFFAVALFSLFMSGCAVRLRGGVYASSDPGLILISPGVYVVEGYSATAYYTAGHYYYYDGGVWYQSSRWGGARVRIQGGTVPRSVYSRDHARYRRYRATRSDRVRKASKVRSGRATRVRSNRARHNDRRERSNKRRTKDRERSNKRRTKDRRERSNRVRHNDRRERSNKRRTKDRRERSNKRRTKDREHRRDR